MQNEFDRRKLYEERDLYERKERRIEEELLNKFKKEVEDELIGMNPGGYIILDLPGQFKKYVF